MSLFEEKLYLNNYKSAAMKKYTMFFLLLMITTMIYSQKSTESIVKNGKKYLVHTILKGNTMYSISKDYNVSVDEISRVNPELSSGLKEGQKILIPIVGNSVKSFSYTVKEGETYYSILKMFNLKEEEVKALNPGLNKNLTMGQNIILPGEYMLPKATDTKYNKVADTIIEHVVLDHETLYSIAKRFMLTVEELSKVNQVSSSPIKPGMTLKIPIYKKEVKNIPVRSVDSVTKLSPKVNDKVEVEKPNNHALTFLLPFNADKMNDPTSIIATEFYMGAQLALDSLLKLGYNGKVLVLDAGSDSTSLEPLLRQSDVIASNLIIGPFNGDNLESTALFCKKQKINMVSPIVASTTILKENPFVYNASTSEITLAKGMAKHIFNSYPYEQVMLVKVGAKDNELYQAFRAEYMKLGPRKIFEVNEKDLMSFHKKGKNCVFVVLSRDRALSTSVSNALMAIASKPNSPLITLIGTKEWINFDDISGEVKNKLNFKYAASVDFDIAGEPVLALKKLYKQKYNSALTKYGAQGFDITLYYVQKLLMNQKPTKGTINNIILQRTKEGSGFENKACFIFQQDDYKVSKVAEIND